MEDQRRDRGGKGNPHPQRGRIKREIAREIGQALSSVVGGRRRGPGDGGAEAVVNSGPRGTAAAAAS
ncbi:hypothetical protein AXF42_Ash003585 [Apostasia shenzhenica]|uniref:Uncharacterized protein n=1 Tax=Apostasia shenzhenica TaxID=1088818 RepID=A0A2I0BGK0_9ASPA|nr:hypothetical protein AXF42_Ash003585 [Apostasia shenzhenica]